MWHGTIGGKQWLIQHGLSPLPLPLGLWTGQVEEVVTQVGSGGTTTDICIGSGVPELPFAPPITLLIDATAVCVAGAQVGESYALIDGMGRVVREGRVPADRLSIDLADVPSGAYTLGIAGKDHAQAKRFVWVAP